MIPLPEECNIIKCTLSTDDYVLKGAQEGNNNFQVPLKQKLKIGNKLELINNEVVIKDDVKYVEVSGSILLQSKTENFRCLGVIMKNNNGDYFNMQCITNKEFYTYSLPKQTISVKKGDKFSLLVSIYGMNNQVNLREYTDSTFLEVKTL